MRPTLSLFLLVFLLPILALAQNSPAANPTPGAAKSPTTSATNRKNSSAQHLPRAAKPANPGSPAKSPDLKRVDETRLKNNSDEVSAEKTRQTTAQENCVAGSVWNGISCVNAANNVQNCPKGERWNGQVCISDPSQCAIYSGQGQLINTEAQAIKDQIRQSSCTRASATAQCKNLYSQQDAIKARYLALQGEAPIACHASLPVVSFR